MCSPCGLGLSPHGGGLAGGRGAYVHGLGYGLVGLGGQNEAGIAQKACCRCCVRLSCKCVTCL